MSIVFDNFIILKTDASKKEMMDANITIIGAGVVGLAIAEKVSEDRKNVFLIEKHTSFGQETSSRNSEVIHAGIYYTKDSLKDRDHLQLAGAGF